MSAGWVVISLGHFSGALWSGMEAEFDGPRLADVRGCWRSLPQAC
ncbi:MAG: hypothetical protein AAF889_13635 [Cyanobacteria bacterium P01_D01_bin.73]